MSDRLIDRFASMVRANELVYVCLQDCFSFQEETQARTDGRSPEKADTSTVHGTWSALQRRALAMHSAGICSQGYWQADLGKWLYNQLVGDNREKVAYPWSVLEPVDRAVSSEISRGAKMYQTGSEQP